MINKKYFLVILCFVISCTNNLNHELPKIEYKSEWQSLSKYVSQNELKKEWWRLFADERLNKIIRLALKNNLDVKIALENIEKSRIQKNIISSDFYPSLDYNLSGSKNKRSIVNNVNYNKDKTNQFSSSFDLSWELDLWGKVRNSRKSALFKHLSVIDVKNATELSLIAEVIKNYAELRGFQKQLYFANQNINLLDKTAKLVKIKEKSGIATKFDIAKIASEKEIIEASTPNIKGNIYSRIYSLSTLIGKNPIFLKNILMSSEDLPQINNITSVSIPSEILRRRPDIKEVENLLIAANSDIKVAIADFFPSISISGALGKSASQFSKLSGSSSVFWQYGFGLNLPFFKGGELMSRYKEAKSDEKIAILNYQKIVLNAFLEVETNLVKYNKEIETSKKLLSAFYNNKEIVDIVDKRYEAGIDDLLSVIDSKRNLITVKNSLVESQVKVLINLALLMKSLGGGLPEN